MGLQRVGHDWATEWNWTEVPEQQFIIYVLLPILQIPTHTTYSFLVFHSIILPSPKWLPFSTIYLPAFAHIEICCTETGSRWTTHLSLWARVKLLEIYSLWTETPRWASVQFSPSVVSDTLQPHELQHARPPFPSPTPRVDSLMSIELVIPTNHLTLCHPLLLPPSIFPSIRVFSNEHVRVKSLSRVWLFSTPWTVAYQARPPMGFSRQEYWNGLPFSSPGDLPDPGIEPRSPALRVGVLPSKPAGKSNKHSKTIKGGGWALPKSNISHSRSQKTSMTTHAQKGSLEVKGEWCQQMLYPQAFAIESILERCACTHGKKQCLIKVQTATLTQISLPLSFSLWVSLCVYLHLLYSFLPPNKYFTCFTTFCLCGNYFLHSRKAKALVTDHGSSD